MANTTWYRQIPRAIMRVFRSVIPAAGDSGREWIRKIAFLSALLVFIGAGYYLIDELLVQPQKMTATATTLRDWFYSGDDDDEFLAQHGGVDPTVYPDGMDPAFKRLYRANSDVRGWLKFTAGSEKNDVFDGNIDNPVVQTADNDYYLDRDFFGNYDKGGTLFFDYRNDLSAELPNRNTIIYGHNLSNGLMFSRFNRLVTGDVSKGRQLTTVSLRTLYGEVTYKVMAVMVLNADQSEGPVFNYLRTEFSTESSFMRFVKEIRKRSLFDYNDVDVIEGDDLLTLSACTNKRESKLNNGRVVIVARRLRDGESATVDTSKTVKNDDVLMPLAWYTNQNKELPAEYQNSTTTTTQPTVSTSDNTASTTTPTTPSVTGPSASVSEPTTSTHGSTTPTTPSVSEPSTSVSEPTTSTDGSTTPTDPSGDEPTTSSGETTSSTDDSTTPTAPSGDEPTTSSGETTSSPDNSTTPTDPSGEDPVGSSSDVNDNTDGSSEPTPSESVQE